MSGTQKQINIAPFSGNNTSINLPATGGLSSLVTLNFMIPLPMTTNYTFTGATSNPNLTLASHGIAENTRLLVTSSSLGGFIQASQTVYQAINVTTNTIQLKLLLEPSAIVPTSGSGNLFVARYSGDWSYCQANNETGPYQVPVGKKLIILTNPAPITYTSIQIGYSDDSAPVFTRRTTAPLNEKLLTPEWPSTVTYSSAIPSHFVGATIPGGKYVFVKYPYTELRGTFFGVLVEDV